jgi:hypothetical protein
MPILVELIRQRLARKEIFGPGIETAVSVSVQVQRRGKEQVNIF